MEEIIERAKNILSEILGSAEIDKGHGIEHALTVMEHARNALRVSPTLPDLMEYDVLVVLLSALLHDADDRKFFPSHTSNENTRYILNQVLPSSPHMHHRIIQCIENVSFSKNGNKLLQSSIDDPFMYPCIADRCEATGTIGIQRCYEYTMYVNRPLFTEDTVRCTSFEELDILAKSRLEDYLKTKFSVSFIDHFYDKIYSLSDIKVVNPYFKKLIEERHKIIVDFLLEYGRTGEIPKF